MVIHVYHPYRQPDGVNHCAAVNGHCSHLCLPAPRIGPHSPRVSCACPNGLRLLPDNQMCVEDSKYHFIIKIHAAMIGDFCFTAYFQNVRGYVLSLLLILLFVFKLELPQKAGTYLPTVSYK